MLQKMDVKKTCEYEITLFSLVHPSNPFFQFSIVQRRTYSIYAISYCICVVCCFRFVCQVLWNVQTYDDIRFSSFLLGQARANQERHGEENDVHMHLIEKFDCLSFCNYILYVFIDAFTVHTCVYNAQHLYGYISFSLFEMIRIRKEIAGYLRFLCFVWTSKSNYTWKCSTYFSMRYQNGTFRSASTWSSAWTMAVNNLWFYYAPIDSNKKQFIQIWLGWDRGGAGAKCLVLAFLLFDYFEIYYIFYGAQWH